MTASPSVRQQLDGLSVPFRDLDGARRGLPAFRGLAAEALAQAASFAPAAAADFAAVAGVPLGAHTLAGELLEQIAPVERDANLSEVGRRAQLLPLLARFRSRAERLRERVDRGREALAEVRGRRRAKPTADFVAALRARELRDLLASLPSGDRVQLVRDAIRAVEARERDSADSRELLLAVADAPGAVRERFGIPPETLASAEAALDPQRALALEALAWAVDQAEVAIEALDHWIASRESSAGAPRFRRPTDDPAAAVEQARDAVRRAIGPDARTVA